MDGEQNGPEDRTDVDEDAWSLPRSPLVLAVPPQDNWPEPEQAFEEGLTGMPSGPPPAA